MKTSILTAIVCLLACMAIQAGGLGPGLPGTGWTIEKAVTTRSSPVDSKFAYAAEYEALDKAEVMVGNMTNGARQKCKVIQVLAGPAPQGEVTLSYRFLDFEPAEREIKKGERVIWIFREELGNDMPTKALPDTDDNRKSVLDALKTAGIPTTAATTTKAQATQPDPGEKN